jgi:hypothetical protein
MVFTPNQPTTWRQHKAMFCVEIESMLNGNQHTMLNPSQLSLLCTKSDDYLDFWTCLLSILSSLLRIARLFLVNMFIIHSLWKVIFPSYILKQQWWCLSVCLAGQGQGRAGRAGAGQGGQTFSVTLRITDFWPWSGFGNFDLLLLLAAAISKDHWPKVTGTSVY